MGHPPASHGPIRYMLGHYPSCRRSRREFAKESLSAKWDRMQLFGVLRLPFRSELELSRVRFMHLHFKGVPGLLGLLLGLVAPGLVIGYFLRSPIWVVVVPCGLI